VYSFDYAPFWHLKEKTKYLLTFDEYVTLIFIRNYNPDVDFLDEGDFRHSESLYLKNFKDEIRELYNPRKEGELTHDHVIHASDSQEQAHRMLIYLGYELGVYTFKSKDLAVQVPWHIDLPQQYHLRSQKLSELYCNIVEGDSWERFKISTVSIDQSPHFLGLSDISIYANYIQIFMGGPLKDYYSSDKYLTMSKSFTYLSAPNENSYIIIKRIQGKSVIQDGLHRAALLYFSGKKNAVVCDIGL
jgi:hypothetical protein